MGGIIAELESVGADGTLKAQLNKSISHVREFTNYNNWGVDSVPALGSKVYLVPLGSQNDKIGMGVRRPDTQAISKVGETRLYSDFGSQVYLKEDGTTIIQTSGGAIVTMRTDGKIELNGNAQSSMTFQDFLTIWDAFIVAYEAHFHNDPVSGVTGSALPVLTAGEKDMSGAENDKVLMNG